MGHDWDCERQTAKASRVRYHASMKSKPVPTAEYTNFEEAMRTLLRVPKEAVNREMEREKRASQGKPKRGPKRKSD